MAKDSSATKDSSASSSDSGHPLEDAIQKGYLGEVLDPKPNEEYTVEGVQSAPDVTDDAYADAKAAEAAAAPATASSSSSSGSGS